MSINRSNLVQRHNPILEQYHPRSPLSVGNGELAYTADITGFQSFTANSPDTTPLCTMTQWAFHSYPAYEHRAPMYSALKKSLHHSKLHSIGYMDKRDGQEELFDGLRINPHRANLFNLSLKEIQEKTADFVSGDLHNLRPEDCSEIRQELDLWHGVLSGKFRYKNHNYTSRVCCHPSRELLGFNFTSDGLCKSNLVIALSFPYPSPEIHGSNWNAEDKHQTTMTYDNRTAQYHIKRKIDSLEFLICLNADNPMRVEQVSTHTILLSAPANVLSFTIEFVRDVLHSNATATAPITRESCETASAEFWENFWTTGAAIDFEGSSDPRARELERRIILSRYLTAIQCSGSLPPQETGLTCNSWYGKFHLEMHLLHAAQFPLWGNPEMLEKSMNYYLSILDTARERAAEQGYCGARFPKMTDPEGFDSPSPIGPFLCWQQPHFIIMAEVLFQTKENTDILEHYYQAVFEIAEFMASYPSFDPQTDEYNLSPPLIPVQENHSPESTYNPVFEVEYWKLGLDIASTWMTRLHKPVPLHWKEVSEKLAAPPVDTQLGAYAAHRDCKDTYGRYATDHPSFLMAYSYVAGRDINPDIMDRSLDLVNKHWKFETSWGWDFPIMAMTAARLGRKKDALDFLLMDKEKNTYLANGHNEQSTNTDLPLYLPGNGSLLLAIAMMAAGWKGSKGAHPGFPGDGSWSIKAEGFKKLPF